MALFLCITALVEPNLPAHYVSIYTGKVLLVTATLLVFRPVWQQDIRADFRTLPAAVIVGLLVFVLWIGVDRFTPPLPFSSKRIGYDPFTAIADPVQRGLFLTLRFFGLVIMVPVMEELFWRSFLLRYITAEDFRRVPMGQFSATAFGVVTVAFGLAHPEWLAALLCGATYAGLLRATRSLFSCIAAHSVTNLALGLYVITTGQWKFW
ncbi:MAG: CAAX prenyl protease-related protein [Chloroherpetonaceae bacterium]|nr:CAAX prenyl protease-related protein [Chthonomonadaceae bacterium]MDW8209209.1 CAAX prenyl protease-related protein [Chloroherpetonaceae bacterium]